MAKKKSSKKKADPVLNFLKEQAGTNTSKVYVEPFDYPFFDSDKPYKAYVAASGKTIRRGGYSFYCICITYSIYTPEGKLFKYATSGYVNKGSQPKYTLLGAVSACMSIPQGSKVDVYAKDPNVIIWIRNLKCKLYPNFIDYLYEYATHLSGIRIHLLAGEDKGAFNIHEKRYQHALEIAQNSRTLLSQGKTYAKKYFSEEFYRMYPQARNTISE